MAGHVISPEFNAGEHTDAAALIGTAAPAIKSMAEPIYEELGLVRIQRWQGEGEAWPESSAASTSAAAGVRDSAGVGLQLAFERTESTGGSYEAAGARWSYYTRRRCSGARSSPAMAGLRSADRNRGGEHGRR